jgi:DDE superfamily endonuclease
MFQLVTTTLQMLVFPTLSPSCSLTEVYTTILLSGVTVIFGALYVSHTIQNHILHSCDSPTNAQELFNLCHASACNVVEQIFRILKNHFAILRSSLDLSMDVQACIAPALTAIHNVIWEHDTGKIDEFLNSTTEDSQSGEHTGDLAEGSARTAER